MNVVQSIVVKESTPVEGGTRILIECVVPTASVPSSTGKTNTHAYFQRAPIPVVVDNKPLYCTATFSTKA